MAAYFRVSQTLLNAVKNWQAASAYAIFILSGCATGLPGVDVADVPALEVMADAALNAGAFDRSARFSVAALRTDPQSIAAKSALAQSIARNRLLTARLQPTRSKFSRYSADGSRILRKSIFGRSSMLDADTGELIFDFPIGFATSANPRFDGDGLRVVGSWPDGKTKVYDALTGAELITIDTGAGSTVTTARFSPDGTRIMTVSRIGNYRARTAIWDASTGEHQTDLETDRYLILPVFSPDGETVLGMPFNRDGADVFDARSGKQIFNLGQSPDLFTWLDHWGLAIFSPDGQRILTLQDNVARVWDAESGLEIDKADDFAANIAAARWREIENGPSNELVIAGRDGRVLHWSIAQNNSSRRWLLPHIRGETDVTYSPDGNFLATAGADGVIRLYESDKILLGVEGALIETITADGSPLDDIIFSPNSEVLASSTEDRRLQFWTLKDREKTQISKNNGNVIGSCPTGETALVSGFDEGSSQLVDMRDGALISTEIKARKAIFSNDCKILTIVDFDGHVQRFDGVSGAPLGAPSSYAVENAYDISDVSSDGRYALVLIDDGVEIIDMSSGESLNRMYPPEHDKGLPYNGGLDPGDVRSAFFALNDSRVILRTSGVAYIWVLDTGELKILRPSPALIGNTFVSRDEKTLVTLSYHAGGGAIWNIASGDLIATLNDTGKDEFDYASRPKSVHFSPDGTRFVYVDGKDGFLIVRGAETGEIIRRIGPNHLMNGGVAALFSGDGSKIFVVNRSHLIAWDSSDYRLIDRVHFSGDHDVRGFLPSHDGSFAIVKVDGIWKQNLANPKTATPLLIDEACRGALSGSKAAFQALEIEALLRYDRGRPLGAELDAC